MRVEIIFKLDVASREMVLRDPLIQLFNEAFDELVLDHVVVYRGQQSGTNLRDGAKVSTEVNELGFHPRLLIYGFKVEVILLPHDLIGSCKTFDATCFRVLPVALSHKRGGSLKMMGEITNWQKHTSTFLTGTLIKV